jgi:2-oxoglutarate/2-oxoacid ferredoxin oxidoreductase subunit beta
MKPGDVAEIPQHDGTLLRLRKLHAEYDPTDRIGAMNYVQQHQARGEIVTGLLYRTQVLRSPIEASAKPAGTSQYSIAVRTRNVRSSILHDESN